MSRIRINPLTADVSCLASFIQRLHQVCEAFTVLFTVKIKANNLTDNYNSQWEKAYPVIRPSHVMGNIVFKSNLTFSWMISFSWGLSISSCCFRAALDFISCIIFWVSFKRSLWWSFLFALSSLTIGWPEMEEWDQIQKVLFPTKIRSTCCQRCFNFIFPFFEKLNSLFSAPDFLLL